MAAAICERQQSLLSSPFFAAGTTCNLLHLGGWVNGEQGKEETEAPAQENTGRVVGLTTGTM